MNKKVVHSDFFKTPNPSLETAKPKPLESENSINCLFETDVTDIETNKEGKGKQEGLLDNDLEIEAFFNEIHELLSVNGLSTLINELQKIHTKFHRSNFQISVVGEFSRGKSTLINRILGQDVLPVGDTPTTSMITKVVYNKEPKVVLCKIDGIKKAFPISDDSLETIIRNQEDHYKGGVVYVGLNNPWLRKFDVEIVDTPGAGDLNDDRIRFVDDAILSSDGVLIAVSALAPLSLTEISFIEQRLLMKKVPHLAIALTRLDQIPEKERASIVKYMASKVERFTSKIPIFITSDNLVPVETEKIVDSGITKICHEIEAWIQDSNHNILKQNNVCFDLLQILSVFSSNVRMQIELHEKGDEEQQIEKANQELMLKRINMKWESLQTEIIRRSNLCISWLTDAIRERQESIIERFQYELSHSSNPYQWWEKDYPYRFKTEMLNLSATLESNLNSIFSKDMAWLADSVSREFKMQINSNPEQLVDRNIFKEATPCNEGIKPDLSKWKTRSRMGIGAVTIIAYRLLPPWGMAASIVGGFVTEKILNEKIEEQQRQLSVALTGDIPKLIDRAIENVEKRLSNAYQNAFQQVQESANVWLSSQTKALENAINGYDKNQLESLIVSSHQSGVLTAKIRKIMENNNAQLK